MIGSFDPPSDRLHVLRIILRQADAVAREALRCDVSDFAEADAVGNANMNTP